ncbi:MAG: hypothetical protein FWB96_00395 [Defluviitaleaceae bacterium]|nr:hypothetical protein [Defluviitaleaceae bacterium]MCL2261829.1 hypothetical protein [Defluviitaleaceae bacterium]
MRLAFANFNENSNETQGRNGVFRLNNVRENRPNNTRTGRQRDMMQERMAAHEREMRIREMEEKRIANIRDEIHEVENSEMGVEAINLTVTMLTEKIAEIFTQRAEREQLAIEREFQRQQQEMEERMRERERQAHENMNTSNKSDEELEAAAERSQIRNMTVMGARLDTIGEMSRTRASMSAEATRLRNEADNDNTFVRRSNDAIRAFVSRSNAQDKEIAYATGTPLPTPMAIGHLFTPRPLGDDTFRGRHFQNLNIGIARLTSGINQQIGALYRDSQNLQNEQLRIFREQSNLPSQEEEDENREPYENLSFDIRL